MTDTDNLAALAEAVEAGGISEPETDEVPPLYRFNSWAWYAYHGDLNAAVRLVEALLPDMEWSVAADGEAYIYDMRAPGEARWMVWEAKLPNPARALLLAALRAKIGGENA